MVKSKSQMKAQSIYGDKSVLKTINKCLKLTRMLGYLIKKNLLKYEYGKI